MDWDKKRSARPKSPPIGAEHTHCPLQNKNVPEEFSASGSDPAHERRVCPGPDDPCDVQPLPTAGNGEIPETFRVVMFFDGTLMELSLFYR